MAESECCSSVSVNGEVCEGMPSVSSEEAYLLADYALYRRQMYMAASSAFAFEPTAVQLRAVVSGAAIATIQDCVRPCEHVLLEHMRGYEGRDMDGLRLAVASEYAELFVGPRPPLAPLYESVYVGFPKRLCSDITRSVRSFYERHGMTVVKRNRIPDDHIAYELEFLARLCSEEAQAWKAADVTSARDIQGVELQFIVVHLGQWVGLFAERVVQASCSDYYGAWARFVRDFVAQDDDYLAGALTQITTSKEGRYL